METQDIYPCRMSSQTHAVMRHVRDEYNHCRWSHYYCLVFFSFVGLTNELDMITFYRRVILFSFLLYYMLY